VSAARSNLRDGDEWATPALWLRTRDGRLWREQPAPVMPAAPGGIQIGGNVGTLQQIEVKDGGSVGSIIGSQVNYGAAPPAPPTAGNAAALDAQRKILAAHRRTLAHYLEQLAISGVANARPEISHGIAEARVGIAKAKQALTALGAPADDHPDDTP
jgi:hypothetical protein